MSIIASQYITGRKVIYLTDTLVYKDANIRSAYSLCASVSFEKLTAQPASAYTLCTPVEKYLTAIPASAYLLEAVNPNPDVDLEAHLLSAYNLSTEVT